MQMKKWSTSVAISILTLFIFYFHFHKLSVLPFRVWDEARLATSAYEMSKSGDWVVVTLGHVPDLIGTKPPLMIWAESACIKLFGLTEFAIRLPAALCAVLTICIVFMFVNKLTGSKWSALASSIVLCTANCYLFDHATRNGEYDSMLTMFTTASLLLFYLYTEDIGCRKNFYLLLFFFFLALAALTKGVAALLFAPGLFIYLIISGRLVPTISNKYLLVGLFLFVGMVSSFYIFRELKGAGYLHAVAIQELGGRFNTVIEGHTGPWDFYWGYLKCEAFGNWYWALPASILLFWFFPNPKLVRATGFCLLTSISMLMIISASQTKLWWYVLPAIPLFAIIISVLIDQISGALSLILSWNKQIVTVVLVGIFSIQPTYQAHNAIHYLCDDLSKDNYYAPSYYMRQAAHGERDLKNYTYLCGGYDIQWRLYAYRLNDLGVNIRCVPVWDAPKFKAGDRVIANIPDSKSYIENGYNCEVKEDFYGLRNYLITGIK